MSDQTVHTYNATASMLGYLYQVRVALLWALQQDTARVVVKRPAKAPCLAARTPSHTISGKAVRYDVYVHRKLP